MGCLPADGIPFARRLDLDDLGADVGEQHVAERAGEDAGQVDDADAGEWHWWNPPARMVAAPPSVMPAALAWPGAAGYGLTLSP